jgi:hypothetical protein
LARASAFRSLAFSASSCFSRSVSASIAAPYFAFHARKVERLKQWFQHTSMTDVPAAASRRKPRICAVEKRLRIEERARL